ncbi:MAG: AAA family ATPase [Lentisphaeria bacterium]|nr:AAA family ATPase [Lentisphaeria bacterium]
MKIKKLVIQNINSLYGKFTIDFEAPDFANGIFAITGPTGSGKTTILDAICLALYGRTPRLDGGDRTESLSKGAKRGLAELCFSVDETEYLASCSMTNSAAKHVLSADGKILADSLRKTPALIAELIGMECDQFCRAVLLAQGKFDAFLSAKDNEKANILEQITDTGVYTRIASKVNEVSSHFKTQISKMEAVVQARQLLDDETVRQKKEQLQQMSGRNGVLQKSISELEKLLTGFERINFLTRSLEENLRLTLILEEEKLAFSSDRIRLESGERAARIQPVYDRLTACRKEVENNQKRQQELLDKLPELEREVNTGTALLTRLEDEFDRQEKITDEILKLTGEVILLDNEINTGKKNEISLRTEKDSLLKQQQLLRKNESDTAAKECALAEEKDACRSYLETYANDRTLVEKKARWQEQISFCHDRQRKLQTGVSAHQTTVKKLEEAETELSLQQQSFEKAQAAVAEMQKQSEVKAGELSELLNGKTFENLELEVDLRQKSVERLLKIQSFEQARHKLADGEECPLCGSTVHPFAAGNVPESSREEEELALAKKQLTACRRMEQQCIKIKSSLLKQEITCGEEKAHLQMAENAVANLKTAVEDVRKQLEELQAESNAAVARLTEELTECGFEWLDISTLPPEVDQRILEFSSKEVRLQELEKSSAGNIQNLAVLKNQLEKCTADLAGTDEKIRNIQADTLALISKRQALFGEKNPEEESRLARKQLEEVRKKRDTFAVEHARKTESLRTTLEMLNDIKQILAGKMTEEKEFQQTFLDSCGRENMSVADFEQALLQAEELTRLVAVRTDLDTRTRTLAGEKTKFSSELETLEKEFPAGFDAASSRGILEESRKESRQLIFDIGVLSGELDSNEKTRQQNLDELKELENMRQRAVVWYDLDKLIGGSGGYIFKRIAQVVTLENLLCCANNILKGMNGRYELILRRQNQQQLLAIDVIDHWQGSEIRPSENLSGGERFQISLSLALGLSSMGGKNSRMDSIFLDEGFGTLDANSLDQALQTLAALQRGENKLIGIISHVQAISDNIASVIEVIPRGGGRSRLAGVGVSES